VSDQVQGSNVRKNVKQWEAAVNNEHGSMVKHDIWQAILKRDIPAPAKILTSIWAMKKKASNGTFRVQLNAQGL
jgi:galactokinase/mevalonate kinase-like predicted kinase